MSVIHLLDELTANQIAAGEVIERPASVVKELVENSLDAGAEKIVVEINKGGLKLIKVTDDGSGMTPEDVSLAVKPHATSKIKAITDLNGLQSLGFRGEALPSITSVARVEIVTRIADAHYGTKLTIAGDKDITVEPVGSPVGSTITVADLFFNTPARKKFLRSEGYESGLIHELLMKISLSQPQVSFRMIRDGKEVLNTTGINTHPDLLSHYYGNEVREALVKVCGQLPGGKITGYVTLPTYHRTNRKAINFFINHRRIFSKELLNALEEAYRNTLPKGKFPLCVLDLNLDPATIDVNVHPSKLEVRLRNPVLAGEMCFLIIQTIIKQKKVPHYFLEPEKLPVHVSTEPATSPELSSAELTASEQTTSELAEASSVQSQCSEPCLNSKQTSSSEPYSPFEQSSPSIAMSPPRPTPSSESITPFIATISSSEPVTPSRIITSSHSKTPATEENVSVTKTQFIQESLMDFYNCSSASKNNYCLPPLKVVGQLDLTFILAEGEEGLYIIDQHVAHERVIFENLLEKTASGSIASQVLLHPVTLHLTLLEEEVVIKHILPLTDMGIILENFGPKSYLLRAVPAGIDEEPQDFFYSLLQHLEKSMGKTEVRDLKKEFLIHTSCKMAVKAKKKMVLQEMEQLLNDLSKTKNFMTCPHGRPIIYKVTYQELRKVFQRI